MGEFARDPKQPAERNKLSSGNVQRCFSLLLLVLPPTYLPRFQPPTFKIYTQTNRKSVIPGNGKHLPSSLLFAVPPLPARLTAYVLVPRSRPLQTLPAIFRAAIQGPSLRGLTR